MDMGHYQLFYFENRQEEEVNIENRSVFDSIQFQVEH